MNRVLSMACVAVLVLLGGCATAPATRGDSANHPEWQQVVPPAQPLPSSQQPRWQDETEAPSSEPAMELRQISEGTGSFINQGAAARRPKLAGGAGEVVFNFEGESLQAVIKAILGDLLQENYVIAPGVQGSVTFSTAKPIRADQAMSVLEMLLSWNNAALVWGDGRYTVLPVDRAVAGNLTLRAGPMSQQRGYEVRAVPLRFISATEMEKVLKPYARPNAVVNVDNARNMLILGGTRAELENYLQTVEIFDVDWLAGMSVGIYPLQQAEASKVVGELEKIFGDGATTPMAGMFRFLPLEGVNSVMVITPQPRYLSAIEEWMERFDLGGGQAGQRLYVYDVKNVKATDLASTLSEIFGSGGGSGSSSVRSPSGDPLMPGLEPVEVRTLGRSGQPELPQQQQQQQSRGQQGGKSAADGGAGGTASGPLVDASGGIALGAIDEVRISAVEESNALLVRATSGQWESIRRTIERLDTIPLQVFIEAQIVRVTLNEALEYGVQWYFENGVPSDTGTAGSFGLNLAEIAANRTSWSGLGGSASVGGLGWTFVGRSAAAIISTLDDVSKATVLSAPTLTVLNNKSATINVGTQIPVTSSFIGGNTGTGQNNLNQQSYVQFRQTGITLTVTPRVNPGGLVFMEVDQQESAPVAGSANATGNASVDNRTITTEVAVQSGATLVLGGLIKNTSQDKRAGIPGLSRLPFIGGLFGKKINEDSREELLVLITPRVIYNESDARRITDDYRRKFRGLEPLNILRPIPKQEIEIEAQR